MDHRPTTEADVGIEPAWPLIGAVLTGGRSSRFGRDKALVDVEGQPMGSRIVTALRDTGADPVVAVGGSAGSTLGVPTVADRRPGEGPLAALATILVWARRGLVVVVPCDLPLLRAEHLGPLVAAASPERAAVAVVGGRPQPSVACWPAPLGPSLLSMLAEGRRAWRDALEAGPWIGVEVPADAVADADTPSELAARLGRSTPVRPAGRSGEPDLA